VSALERGKRRLDQPDVVEVFARALDCDPAEITGPEPDPAQDTGPQCQGAIGECLVTPIWEVQPRDGSEVHLACRRHQERMIHEIATGSIKSGRAIAIEVRLLGAI
jgi:hypothetical protein